MPAKPSSAPTFGTLQIRSEDAKGELDACIPSTSPKLAQSNSYDVHKYSPCKDFFAAFEMKRK
jgi:hypothetical protein